MLLFIEISRLLILTSPIEIVNKNRTVLYFHQRYDCFVIHAINSARHDFALSGYTDINYIHLQRSQRILWKYSRSRRGLRKLLLRRKKVSAAKARL